MKGVGPYRICQVISNAPIQSFFETVGLSRMLSLIGMDEDDVKPKYYTLLYTCASHVLLLNVMDIWGRIKIRTAETTCNVF